MSGGDRRPPSPESTSYRAHVQRAEALVDLGRSEQALVEARAALALDLEKAKAWLEAARALVDLGRLDEALEHCEKGLAVEPRSTWGHRLLSFVRSRRGEHQLALDAVEEALRIDAEDPACLRRKARCLWALGRKEPARLAIVDAVSRSPHNAEGFGFLSDVALGMGDLETATRAAREAVALLPDRAWPLQCLGDALDRQKDVEGAIVAFHRAVVAEPAKAYPRERLVELVRIFPLNHATVLTRVAWMLTASVPGLALLVLALRVGADPDLLGPLAAVLFIVGFIGSALLQYRVSRARLERASPGVTALAARMRRDAWARRWTRREP